MKTQVVAQCLSNLIYIQMTWESCKNANAASVDQGWDLRGSNSLKLLAHEYTLSNKTVYHSLS